MTLLIGALTIGFILSLLAMGVMISFRIFEIPDITTDGSITSGAAIVAVMLVANVDPLLATIAGALGGAVAGMATGVIHTKFKINSLLSGILVMTALYSINLHIMGRSNVPLMRTRNLSTYAEEFGKAIFQAETVNVFGWPVGVGHIAMLFISFTIAALAGFALYLFFRTHLGTAMRATGDNQQMARAMGVNVEGYIILGLALSNGLVALGGALYAQYQGFADAQSGIGMIVLGLASIIIGEALTGERSLGLTIIGAIMGSILFRLLVAVALRWGLNPYDLKVVTAIFVFGALVLPRLIGNLRRGRALLS